MKTLQYLAEDATNEDQSSRSFTNIASAVIQDLFKPSDSYSVNEQVTVLFQAMGWKNAQIKLTSANEANILLGSNRHLDQDPNSESALKLLVGTISKALGYHVLDREIDAVVDIDIHNGPIYSIDIKAIKARKPGEEEVKKPKPKEQIPAKPIQRMESPATSTTELTPTFDTSQLFLPILSNKLPIGRLHLMLQDVLVEFSQSWYGTNPIEETSSSDERENVVTLITYLVQQSIDRGSSPVDTGTRLGTFFGHAITQNFNTEENPITQEIIDGSEIGSIIRDIKARAFCSLNPGEKCGPNIGNANRALCDFSMGLWQGCLTELGELGEKDYTFTGFYTAGKRDPYCLMEFSAK
jgi:hypothetical protein